MGFEGRLLPETGVNMYWRTAFLFLAGVIGLSASAQTVEPPPESRVPMLAFKLLIRPAQTSFAPGQPLELQVACVSVPKIASEEWQERWNNACSDVKVEIEEARLGGYWGGVGLIAWLQNRLHLCLLPPGQSYQEESYLSYTKPQWQSVTVPTKKLSGLRGMVQINAQVILKDGEKQLDQEFAQAVTAIVADANSDAEADLNSDIQLDAAAVQSGDLEKSKQLADKLLEFPTNGALTMAVRLFDNTRRTGPLWTVIENSPHQQKAIDLMLVRLKDPDLLPDYNLLVNLTGMKARLDEPLEFDSSDRQPYPEYHPNLEDTSVAYFRFLLNSLVNSSGDLQSARANAIAEISASLAESDRCPLGTYGLSSTEASAIFSKLSGK
jgi:hypothetical protein